MEILFAIGGFFLLFILIAPLINAFGSNSPHKDKSQDEKKEQALKDIKNNYDTSKDLLSKGLNVISNGASQLERLTGELADKAEKNRRELQRNKPEYYRAKLHIANTIEHNRKMREYDAQAYFLGLDLGLKDFKFEDIYNTETYKDKKNELLTALEKNEELLKPIKNFIAVRYYLTTFKEYPKISALNTYFDDKIPESFPVFHELIWEYCLKQLKLDKSKLKKISRLYHFTHKNNLRSILNNGLVTKARLEKLEINFIENDKNRWDGVEDSISLSIRVC